VVNDSLPRRLLARSLVALAVCAALVTLCYFFVDRPVAFFVHDHGIAHLYPVRGHPALAWVTYPPPILQTWAPAVLAALTLRRAFGAFRRWELTLLVACVSLLVAVQFKDTLKFAFGRYWPDTWIRHNPSLIQDDAYGFHPFHEEISDEEGWYGSFPVAVGLIGMNYHFVGDVVAGAFVGGLVGVCAARFAGLAPDRLSGE